MFDLQFLKNNKQYKDGFSNIDIEEYKEKAKLNGKTSKLNNQELRTHLKRINEIKNDIFNNIKENKLTNLQKNTIKKLCIDGGIDSEFKKLELYNKMQ